MKSLTFPFGRKVPKMLLIQHNWSNQTISKTEL
jgi:hypothetical protein